MKVAPAFPFPPPPFPLGSRYGSATGLFSFLDDCHKLSFEYADIWGKYSLISKASNICLLYILERNVDILFLFSLSLGEFAEVFKGLFEDSIVAVKILKVSCECVDFFYDLIGFGFDANETRYLFLKTIMISVTRA